MYIHIYLTCLLLLPIVYAVLEDDDLWYSYQFGTGYGNRKELFITKVDAVDKFKTKENILEWRSLSLHNRSIALGLTKNGVTILQLDQIGESFSTNETHIPMNSSVVDACIFKYWNDATDKSEIIIVVAVDAKTLNNSVDLLWFRLGVNNKLIYIWKWSLGKKINHLHIFQLEDESHNILIANDRYENYTTVDWYEFHLGQHNDYWLKQAIRLDTPTNSLAISTFGAHVLLSIPQGPYLRILDLKGNTHFEHYANVSVGLVTFVTSFKVGFQSYLAIDGQSSGVYKFAKFGSSQPLEKEHIDNVYVNGVDYWLSMPMSTYRDEVVLIAERTVDFMTHKSIDIQVIIHHGGKFILHDEMTCDYYGEVSHGLNCLVEEGDTLGIQGSTFLTVNNTLGVLVPRHLKSSGMFVINTVMKELPSPIEERMHLLEDRKKKLEDKMNLLKQSDPEPQEAKNSEIKAAPIVGQIIKQSEPAIIGFNIDDIQGRISKLQETINSMLRDVQKLPVLSADRKEYDTIVLNGLAEIQGRSDIKNVLADSFNGATTEQIKSDIFNLNNNIPITGHKTFANLQTDELEFATINGKPASSLIFKSDELVLEGNVTLEGELIVEGNAQSETVNGLNLEQSIVYIPSDKKINGTLEFENLLIRQALNTNKANKFPVHSNYQDSFIEESDSVENIEFESIFLPGNLSVAEINGENFDQMLSSLCLKNMMTYIPNTTLINGDVFVKDGTLTIRLNKLKYPEDYLMSKSSSFSLITGIKNFTNDLVIDELTTKTVNNIDPNEVITLTADQVINGKMSFAHLEVTNNLKLDGKITGTDAPTIPTKSTLLNSQDLFANFNFKDLEVTGKVTISDTLNKINLKDVLSDVIYKSDVSAEITGVKKFKFGLTAMKNLGISSNAINNVDINNLVRKDTEQVMNIHEINGDVTFENLLLNGTYGNIDIVKLEQESVKLSGEQFISSEIVFEEGLIANDLDIKESLNEIPLEKYLYANGEINLDTFNIPELIVENLTVQDINTAHDNFGIVDFDNRRFSLNKPQSISADFKINASRIPFFSTNVINEYDFNEIFDPIIYTEKLMDLIMNRKLVIKELIVDDTLTIDELNGKLMKNILKLCISNKDGDRDMEMNFEDVRFGDLEVENFNDINFQDFKRNLVFKDESPVTIEGFNVYFNGFEVKNYIQTSALNQIPVQNILRKDDSHEIISPIVILGKVSIVGECKLGETLNNVPIANITNIFEVVNEDIYKIKSDVVFAKGPIIEHLKLKTLNGVDLQDHFAHLIYLNSPEVQHVGNITFGNNVHLTGNLDVGGTINHVDVSKLKDEVVLITQDSIVQQPVIFASDVSVKELLDIESDLYTNNVMGVNPAEWKDKAVFVNKGKVLGELKFQDGVIESNVNTEYLNNINVGTLVHLKNDQVITEKLIFEELDSFKDIKVNQFVNGLKLEPEFLNTVRSGLIQEIHGNVIFEGNVLVREFLDIHETVNEQHLGKIVTTDMDQNLTGMFYFDKVVVNDGLIVGLVNSINMTKWKYNGVKKNSNNLQVMSNTWILGSNLTFKNNVIGNGKINDLDIRKLADDVEYKRSFKYTVENDLIENYKKICADVNSVISTTKKQIFSFKYLDTRQFIELTDEIEYVYHFQHDSKDYLLIKDKGCTSKLFIWMEEFFNIVQEFHMGEIEQIVSVETIEQNGKTGLYLITRSGINNSTCDFDGTNAWKFDEEKLLVVQKLNDINMLQSSKIPGTFYAMESDNVFEYRISPTAEILIFAVRKWSLPLKNAAFLPAGLKTGLAIRNGKQLFKLQHKEFFMEPSPNEIEIGNFTVSENHYIPGADNEILIMNVGYPRWRRFAAIATHEETSVKGNLDFIKIYEDIITGKVFHKVPTYKPSSMITLEFGDNGETLLIFLENKQILQVYEYKGIEGFKFRSKANLKASKLIPMKLPCGINNKPRSFIGVVNKNQLRLLEAVMDGDQLDLDQVSCTIT